MFEDTQTPKLEMVKNIIVEAKEALTTLTIDRFFKLIEPNKTIKT